MPDAINYILLILISVKLIMFASLEIRTSFKIGDQSHFSSKEIKSKNKPAINSPLAIAGLHSSTRDWEYLSRGLLKAHRII